MEHLLEVYGYPLLFLFTFLEGETPLIVAAFLAHSGYFSLPMVMLVAFSASVSADQFFFHLGRWRGRPLLRRRAAWQPKVARAEQLLDRWGAVLVVGFRFLYGLRIVTPFVVGMTGFGSIRFLMLNVIGGVLWSVTISLLGFSLGRLLTAFLTDAKRYELLAVVVIVVASLTVWAINRLRQRG